MATTRVPRFTATCPECGAQRAVWHASNANRRCVPCGRIAIRRHGATGTRLFRIWTGMRQRCGYYPSRSASSRFYADRGISICEAWRGDFLAFAAWAEANGYADDLEIDRIDSAGNYEPGNCRWITPLENKRRMSFANRPRKVSEDAIADVARRLACGERKSALAREHGISATALTKRLAARSRRAGSG